MRPDDSLKVTTEMLAGNPDINVIWASTGPGTYGALQALQSLGNTDIQLYGFCAADEPVTGQYRGCVGQEPYDYGTRVIGQIRSGWAGANAALRGVASSEDLHYGETPAPGEVG